MKTSVKIIIGAGLFILLAGTIGICVHHHYSQRGLRGMRGAAFTHQQGINQRQMRGNNRMADMPMGRGMRPGMQQGQMPGMGRGMDQGRMNGMRRGMGPGQMNGMGRGMGQAPMNGMGRGMGRGMGMGMMPMDRMGRGNMISGRLMNLIPDLTDKQKKEIADLRQKQQEEMTKLREDMTTKMQGLMETHRKKVLDILTPEQKKIYESHTGVATPPLTK
jgi:hypothetical protein